MCGFEAKQASTVRSTVGRFGYLQGCESLKEGYRKLCYRTIILSLSFNTLGPGWGPTHPDIYRPQIYCRTVDITSSQLSRCQPLSAGPRKFENPQLGNSVIWLLFCSCPVFAMAASDSQQGPDWGGALYGLRLYLGAIGYENNFVTGLR